MDVSAHNPEVHVNWPASRIRSFYSLCTDTKEARKASEVFRQKIVSQVPHHVSLEGLLESRRGPSTSAASKQSSSWLVVPYHPCFDLGGMRQRLKSASSSFFKGELAFLAPRLSWSLGSKHLWRRITALNDG